METTSDICVRWTERNKISTFQSKIARMLEEKNLVDVTLSCENFQVKCHRLILAACSPFFADIFSQNSSLDLVICLVGIKEWHICKLISFMYSGVIQSITKDDFNELCKVAKHLQIHGLCDHEEKTESRSEDESTLLGNPSSSNGNGEVDPRFPFMQKKCMQSQMDTSEPIVIDLVNGDSSASGRSDTEGDRDLGSNEKSDIVGGCSDPEWLQSRLTMRKRHVMTNDGEEGTTDRIQLSRNEVIVQDERVRVADSWGKGDGNSSKKIKMDRKEGCDRGSNGSGLDPNLLLGLGLGLQSVDRAEDTVKCTGTNQLHIETKVKEVRRARGRKPKLSFLSSRPDIAARAKNPTEHVTVTRSEEVHPQNCHQQSVLPGLSTQAPPSALDIAEFEGLWINRLLYATYLILYGYSIEQASLSTGIPVVYLTEYLRRHGGSNAQHVGQNGQEDMPSNPTLTNGRFQSYAECELQANAKRIHDQMLLACWNLNVRQGQSSSSSNSNVPQ